MAICLVQTIHSPPHFYYSPPSSPHYVPPYPYPAMSSPSPPPPYSLDAELEPTPSMPPTSSLVNTIHRHPTRPQTQSPDPSIEAISRSVVVGGAEHVVSHGGTSQYNRDGTGASACGLAALNFARIVFSIEQSGLQDTDLLEAALARACAEVLRRYGNPLYEHRLISSTGNHGNMRIVVGKPSSRSRRYLSCSLV
jgi:hypothetical protein